MFYLFAMRLALQTDYALRTLLYLASKPGRASIAQIAEFYGISKDHVAKVVRRLGQLGYIRNLRGVGGGVEMAARPEQITIGEIVLEFEGNMNLLECVSREGVCVIQPGCKLRGVLAEAERIQMEYLDSVTLHDVMNPGQDLVELTVPGEDGASAGPG